MLRRTVKKGIWLTLGVLFLLLAIAGAVLPFLQGFLCFIFSIFCFMRSSTRFNTWVHRQSWFTRLHAWVERQHWFERVRKHFPHHEKHDSSDID